MSDEEIAEKLYCLYRSAMDDHECIDISKLWCDGGAQCVDERGEIDCDEEKHKACILRWVKGPANDE